MDIELGDDWARVVLSGEIDTVWVENHQARFDAMCEDKPSIIVLDLEAVTFMDSTGFGLIAKLCRLCQDHGNVYLANADAQVLTVLNLLGLADIPQLTVLVDGDGAEPIKTALLQIEHQDEPSTS